MARPSKGRERETPFDQVDNIREKPAKDWPSAPFTGAKWGAALGLVGSNIYINTHQVSAFGLSAYGGDAGVVIIAAVVGGALLGAFTGWLTTDPSKQ